MPVNKIISNKEISLLTSQKKYSEAVKLLLELQKRDWHQCSSGYTSLGSVKTKEFLFKYYKIIVQFNPKRLVSSGANIDDETIKQRKCFLCAENLPEEQKGVLINDYLVLCNPFPIASEHFTISGINHKPQRIKDSFGDLLILNKNLSEYYTLFYNGPKCGASAPDHLHFQAVNKFFMPVDSEFPKLKKECGKILIRQDNLSVNSIDDGLRRFISIESDDEELVKKHFKKVYKILSSFGSNDDEPMMNVHSIYDDRSGWRILIFPRSKHRPSYYFKTGEERLLLSPASADMGGVCILPVENDYNAISKEIVSDVFNEVVIKKEMFNQLIGELQEH